MQKMHLVKKHRGRACLENRVGTNGWEKEEGTADGRMCELAKSLLYRN